MDLFFILLGFIIGWNLFASLFLPEMNDCGLHDWKKVNNKDFQGLECSKCHKKL